LGFKSSITRQFDFNPMLAGAQKHGMEGSSKLGGVPDVTIIHEYGGAVGIHGQFQFGSVRAETFSGLRPWLGSFAADLKAFT
jgi:hypothetical protein